jgi:hypothetical protein
MITRASRFGYLFVDHRASPGLPEEVARAVGYDPALCREGKFYEADTIGCPHCGVCVIKNPFRTRARGECPKCNNAYICDSCAVAMKDPDYVHHTVDEIVDKLATGRWALSGTMSAPVLAPLIPTGD